MWSSVFLFTLLPVVALVPSFVMSQILSRGSIPTAYHLKINASDFATSDTFSGSVLVNLTVKTTIYSLVLHSENLAINKSSVVIKAKDMIFPVWDDVAISNLSVERSWINISFYSPLANGEYSLSMEYQGHYQSSMAGFAKVGYIYKKEVKFLGVTGLEPNHARKVFPCYDMMEYRTKIDLEITVNRPYTAISNIKPTLIENISETTRVFLFKNYPVMPVNQLSWAVLNQISYHSHEDNSTSTLIKTHAGFLYLNQTVWANQLTANLVEVVGNYTGKNFNEIESNPSKIEQVVIPEFFTGTSEGYGFMSFSEETILVSPNQSSTRHIQDIALTMAKAVVRQWFGMIVSIDSWQNIWIMKGLDEYLQYVIAESLPEMSSWELGDQAVVELTQPALALDSPESHPLSVQIDNETELVATVSDSLTRYKGGAIIRMLKEVFGNYFKEAMSRFILTSSTGQQPNPTTSTDFWNILYSVASYQKLDLGKQALQNIMQQWTGAPGYPVLSVTANTSHFVISQPSTSWWWVPVSYSLQGSPDVNKTWLQPGSHFSVPATSAKWILLNLNQTGFYRVNYTTELWKSFKEQLETDLTKLPRLSRSQLIDDAFSLDPQMALNFTGFLREETDYFPWITALRHYENLIYSLAGHSSYQLLQDYLLDLMKGVIAGTGFSTKSQDTHVDRLKRSLVLEKACQFGHKNCIQRAVNNLRTWMAGTYYDADLIPALLCAGIANSSKEIWNSVWRMYQYSIFPSIRLTLLKSLTCTQNQELLYEFLNNITNISDLQLSVKHKNIALQTLSSKPFGANILFNWLVDTLKAQTTNSSAETFAPVPESTTQKPESSNTTSTTPSSTDKTTVEDSSANLAQNSSTGTVMTIRKLPESDVTSILSMILPILSTLEQGGKLDYFISMGNATGLSNATLEMMKNSTQRIYKQAHKAMTLNEKLTAWLEEKAVTTSTHHSTQTNTPAYTTPKPSSASRVISGTAAILACLLSMFLRIPAMV